ncbi:MAG TPA: response regulator [candidate division Zixibacteria bacterium]|nr:response regulator [candidate division Zixibacteria bacterium]MDD4917929.1 response regulator [candidate division Zixibacteria bacterium]MDM7972519.1 response regulator [candidate division Zixibacteria bacterium]HOD65226.1 response regulator [candidate division Zixibacteria bacterium]HOZ07248.1 response regulator [candidate division Zixibacteria bacterium]
MAKEPILVIEDEQDIQELIAYNLAREGYRVVRAVTGEDGLACARREPPALVLLDLMLPGVDGLEVCRQLKHSPATRAIPIVMLTAKGEESDIVAGLEMGADDYIAKPFSPKVLIARIRAVLRRKATGPEDAAARLAIHGFIIDPGRHEVSVDGRPVQLTHTEFQILHLLARRPGWVYTRYQIVNQVRGEDVIVTDRSVDVQIVGLRKKLGAAGRYIETVRGVGYRLREN